MSNKIYNLLVDKGAIMTGHFVLTSGLHSNKYIEKFRVLEDPESLDIICKEMADKFKNIDIVVSAAVGGILLSSGVARELGVKGIFAERVEGELIFKRGFKIPENSNVLIVEDVITTGKSALECSNIVKKNKANLVGYACIIDRSKKNRLIKNKIVSQIEFDIETFSENNLPKELKRIKPTKPGSRNLSR